MTADIRASEKRENPFPVPVCVYTLMRPLHLFESTHNWQTNERMQEYRRTPGRQVCPEMGLSLTYVCANHIIIIRLTAALLSGLLKVLGAVKKLRKVRERMGGTIERMVQ